MRAWFLERYQPLRSPEDGVGGGDPAPAPVAPAPAAGDQPAPLPGGTPPASGDAPPAGPYRPEGLPDTMFGKDDRETMDNLAKAVKGYRDRDAQRVVPDKPEAYREFKLDDAPEAIRPHLQGLAADPLFDAVAKVAMEEKIPVATLQKLTTALYSQAQEDGILEPSVDPAVERAALLPETARALPKAQQDAAVEARLQANEDFVKQMTTQGLDKDVAEHGLLMLMDTAKGNQLIEFFKDRMTGGGLNQPFNGQGGPASGQTEIGRAHV